MSMDINKDGKVRTVSSSTSGKVLQEGKLRNIYVIKAKIGGKLYVLWELIKGWIFTSDGYAIETSDGYMIKCNDQ